MQHNGKLGVALVEPIGGHSGNDFYDFGLCKALAEQGMEVVFYTCDETTLDRRFVFPFRTEKTFRRIYGADPKWLRGIRYAFGAFRTVVHASRRRLKLAHLHIYHFASRELLNLLLFRLNGFRIVATIHDVENFETYGQQNRSANYGAFLKRIDRIIVHSEYARQSVIRHFRDFPADRIHIVPHGDADFLFKRPLTRRQARQQLGLPDEARIVLFFGQIKKVKGLDVLLHAWSLVQQKNPRARLVVVGRPWKVEQQEFDRIVAEKNLASSCIFNYNYIPNESIPVYFAAADLVALPYREIYSSGVMVRSLDYGAAIVASDLQAFRSIITDNQNGLLFRNEDAEHLAQRILEVLDDDERLERLRIQAKETAEKKFSWSHIAGEVIEVYKKALYE